MEPKNFEQKIGNEGQDPLSVQKETVTLNRQGFRRFGRFFKLNFWGKRAKSCKPATVTDITEVKTDKQLEQQSQDDENVDPQSLYHYMREGLVRAEEKAFKIFEDKSPVNESVDGEAEKK